MKLSIKFLICCLFVSIFSFIAFANNLNITNVSIVNVSGGTADVKFDISWSNSYRWMENVAGKAITNYDAAWVFIKYRNSSMGQWKHALLADTGHSPSAGSVIEIHSNGSGTNVGAMVYRDAVGNGGVSFANMMLKWDMSKNGLSKTNFVDVKVYAIEMVKIPECRFALGSGGSENYHFYEYPNDLIPYYVTNSGTINIGTNTGDLYYTGGGGDGTGTVSELFPNGFSAFYCMKYEITQGQYADFLNSLPSGYALARFPNQYGNKRHTVRDKNNNSIYSADVQDRACNYLSWTDVSAYLDWAALRPMTELEFEKACRGPMTPVANEYAWGSRSAWSIDSYSGIDGSGTEIANPTNANCHYYFYSWSDAARCGPTRVGIFARAGTTREEAGAGYYGVMELSGNVFEQTITIGNTEGRAFIGNHGDGDIQTAPATWPLSTGIGDKGGAYSYGGTAWYEIRVSDRARTTMVGGRDYDRGGRGVRSAE